MIDRWLSSIRLGAEETTTTTTTMIKFSALNESDSSDDEDERHEGGVFGGAGGVSGVVGKGATKEAQEAEVVELYKKAIEVQQRGGNMAAALPPSLIRDRDGRRGRKGGRGVEKKREVLRYVIKWRLLMSLLIYISSSNTLCDECVRVALLKFKL